MFLQCYNTDKSNGTFLKVSLCWEVLQSTGRINSSGEALGPVCSWYLSLPLPVLCLRSPEKSTELVCLQGNDATCKRSKAEQQLCMQTINLLEMAFSRYQPPNLAISTLYWKAWPLLLVVAAFNPENIGKLECHRAEGSCYRVLCASLAVYAKVACGEG